MGIRSILLLFVFQILSLDAQESAILPADFILIADNNSGTINLLDLNNNSYVNIPLRKTVRPIDIDYDPIDAVIFWTDGWHIYSGSVYGNSTITRRSLSDYETIYRIAVDSVSRLLFYADSAENGFIAVTTLVNNSHKPVVLNVHRLIDLATDPFNGNIYWVAYDEGIMGKSNYDGTNRQQLVINPYSMRFVYNPSIVMDVEFNAGVLYMCDGRNGTIERVNTNGKNHQLIYRTQAEEEAESCSIAVYQSYLFFTFSSDVKRIGKDGTGLISVASTEHVSANAIHVHTKINQGVNGCSNGLGGCSHFCFPLPLGSRECGCPDHMFLKPDGLTCKNATWLLLTENFFQAIIHIDLSTEYNDAIATYYNQETPYAITYDPVNGLIYWTDIMLHRIMSTSTFGLTSKIIRQLQDSASPQGITVDVLSRLLFYTDKTNGIIAVIRLDVYEQKVVISSNLKQPGAIVTDPIHGIIYWTSVGNDGMIEKSNYDGTNRLVIINTGLVAPSGLAIDVKEGALYWCIDNSIYRTNTNGMNRKLIYKDNTARFERIALDQSYLYYTSSNSGVPMRIDRYGGNPTLIDSSFFFEFNDVHVQINEPEYIGTNGCTHGNGNCSHFCFPRPGGVKVCVCPEGMILQSDGQTCEQCVISLQTGCDEITQRAPPSQEISGSGVNLTLILAVVSSLVGLLVIGALLNLWCIRKNRRMHSTEPPCTNSTEAEVRDEEYFSISGVINTEIATEPQAIFNVSTHIASYRAQSDKQDEYLTAISTSTGNTC